MIVKKLNLEIENLLNVTFTFDKKVNVIYGENETGKTTILTFFRYLFFPKARKARPWYVANLTADALIQLNEENFIINFDKKNLRVVPSEKIFLDIEELFDFESFKNSFAITQEELFKIEYFDLLKKKRELFLGVSGLSYSNDLSEMISSLKKDIDKLYKQRGRKPYINQLKDRLKSLEKEINDAKDEIQDVDSDLNRKKVLEKERQDYEKRIIGLKKEIENIRKLLTPFESYLEIRNKKQKYNVLSKEVIVDEQSFNNIKRLRKEMEEVERLIEEKVYRLSVLKGEIGKIDYDIKRDLLDKFKKGYFLYGDYDFDELFRKKEKLELEINNFFENVEFNVEELSIVEKKVKKLLNNYNSLKQNLELYNTEYEKKKGILTAVDENELKENLFRLKKKKEKIINLIDILREKEKILSRINELDEHLKDIDLEKLQDLNTKLRKFNNNPLVDFNEREIEKVKSLLPKIKLISFSLILVDILGLVFAIGKNISFIILGLVLLFLISASSYFLYFRLLRKFNVFSYKEFLEYFNEFQNLKNLKNENIDDVLKKINEIEFLRNEKEYLKNKLKQFDGVVGDMETLDRELCEVEEEIDELKQKLAGLKILKSEYDELVTNIEKVKMDLGRIELEIKSFGFHLKDEEKILLDIEKVKNLIAEKKKVDDLIANINDFNHTVNRLKNELKLSDDKSLDDLAEFVERVVTGQDYKLKLESEYNLTQSELVQLRIRFKNMQKNVKDILVKFGVNSFHDMELGFENFKVLKGLKEEIKERVSTFEKRFGIEYEDYSKRVENVSELQLQNSLNEKISEMEDLQSKLQKVIEDISRLDERINIYMNKDILHKKESELEMLKDILKSKLEEFAIKTFSIKILENTLKRYEEEYQPELLQSSSKYFEKFTNGRYTQIRTNIDGNLFVLSMDNKIKRVDELSAGTKDQLFLALRLGYIDMIDKKLRLPLFFDEITANFDDARELNFLDTLEKISDTRQVFIFTCKKTLVSKLDERFFVYNL
ncbi:AAA family ATPase [Deferribacter abyssi]|uniref:AAA family ATPase n=1 Tax=Deferribacter abyssi TaxID=213806 RepID=UPI003C206620